MVIILRMQITFYSTLTCYATEQKTLFNAQISKLTNTIRCRYPDKSGYRTAVLVYNRIFDIRTTLAAIFVSISGLDIGHSRNKEGCQSERLRNNF
jgi:hypothetical protein